MGLDGIKSVPVYSSGGFVDTYNTGIQHTPAGYATGERYRYLDDGQGTSKKYQYIEDKAYQTVSSRYTGERIMLYAHGSPVAVNRSSGTRGYLGTDILGSTRSITDNHGIQESYYDYDIFGSPVAGDFTTGADYGYLGKPYDSITGLYNYGYRDYSPQVVRFTTVDPIRDGTNWFAYVNNDPVNYVDLWGLLASEGQRASSDIAKEMFQWPLKTNYITSYFGYRTDAQPNNHDGIDLRAAKGTEVYAMAEGIVTVADLAYSGSQSKSSYLVIVGTGGWEQRYLHMDTFVVQKNQKVSQGELLGYSGDRTNTQEHLHIEIRHNGKKIDPLSVLPPLEE